MRRIVIALMSTISGLVMLFSYHTSTNSGTLPSTATGPLASGPSGASGSSGSAGSSGSSGSSGGDTGSTGSTGSGGSGSSSGGSAGSSSGTSAAYTGDSVMTQWGTVQVRITVANGKITKAEAVDYPWNNSRDQQINSYAVPVLNQEAVQAQSASIDAVSGATVTSGGYIQSLQSAIDRANL